LKVPKLILKNFAENFYETDLREIKFITS
jgi:hypothetical protein